MPRGVAARRHAQAVFQLALDRGQLQRWLEELKTVAATLSEPQLSALLQSPKVPLAEKMSLIDRCLPGADQLVLNSVYLLVARRRLGLMDQIVVEYERLADAYQGLEHAEVTTAILLNEEDKAKLSQRLAEITGSRIMLTVRVNPGLIGGFVARIGDRVLDGSTRSKLSALRKSLAQAR